jgi:hypothetical protein
MGGVVVRSLPHNNEPFESFASPMAGLVAYTHGKLLIANDVTGVVDVLPIKLLMDNDVADVADFPTRNANSWKG